MGKNADELRKTLDADLASLDDDARQLDLIGLAFDTFSQSVRSISDDLGMTGTAADNASAKLQQLASNLVGLADTFSAASASAAQARSAITAARDAYRDLPDGELSSWERAGIVALGTVTLPGVGTVAGAVAAEHISNERESAREEQALKDLQALRTSLSSAIDDLPMPPRFDGTLPPPPPPPVPTIPDPTDDTRVRNPDTGGGTGRGPGRDVSGVLELDTGGPVFQIGQPQPQPPHYVVDPIWPPDPVVEPPVTEWPVDPGPETDLTPDGPVTGVVPSGPTTGISPGWTPGGGGGAGGGIGTGGIGGGLAGGMLVGGAALGGAGLSRLGGAGAPVTGGGMASVLGAGPAGGTGSAAGALGGARSGGAGGIGGVGGSAGVGGAAGARGGMASSGLGGTGTGSSLVSGSPAGAGAGAAGGARRPSGGGMMPGAGGAGRSEQSRRRRGGGPLAPDIAVSDADAPRLGAAGRAGSRDAVVVRSDDSDDDSW